MTASPERLVLENVPRVSFYEGGPRCPKDICFPSVLRALMEYGDVLVGWSFFQNIPEFNAGVEFEPSGQFRARGWSSYPGLRCIFIGGRWPAPPTCCPTA